MSTPLESLQKRISELTQWLARHCPEITEEQAHLKEGSREQAYWNYGYLIALRDVAERHSSRENPLR